MTQKLEIYGREGCSWCVKAKELAELKGLDFEYHDFTDDLALRQEMIDRAKAAGVVVITVPQIFMGERHIGGFVDLARMITDGEIG